MKFRITSLAVAASVAVAVICGCATAGDASPAPPTATPAQDAPQTGTPKVAINPANPPHRAIEDPLPPPSAPEAMRAVPCATRDVTLKPGGSNGDFNGMSHSGAYLTLTNRSRNPCSVPGLPQLTFLDANGPVKADADLPGAKFMHPGPVVLPLVLQPKQSVATSVRWVSGPVYSDNLCYKLNGVTLALSSGSAMMPLAGQMCGERSKGVHYDLQRYGAAK